MHNSKIARLARVDPNNNKPYLVPLVFAFDDNNIFIPIDDKPKTIKSDQLKRVINIQKKPNVSFLIDTYDDKDWINLSYLMIQGKARIESMVNDLDTINKYRRFFTLLIYKESNIILLGLFFIKE